MNESGLSLARLQEVPTESLILLTGPPGAGKSVFCHQAILNSLALDQPVILVTTEQRPAQVLDQLRQRGLAGQTSEALNFVDVYSDTVGVQTPDRSDSVRANCADLNSISIATTRLREQTGRKGILLAFDSLTSPYLFNGAEVTRFVRLFLSRFAAEGNSVLALLDEGCAREEDLTAMMSMADGVISVQARTDRQQFTVVKHPQTERAKVEVALDASVGLRARTIDTEALREFVRAMIKGRKTARRRRVGDYVNLFWPNMAHWSGVSWNPKEFSAMTYDLNRDDYPSIFRLCQEDKEAWTTVFPWRMRLALRFMPGSLSEVGHMKNVMKRRARTLLPERVGVIEYLEESSRTDEHFIRVYESSDCCGFEHVGTSMASYLPPLFAGMCMALESLKGLDRDWNAVETKCIGLGDPYCEFKLVPGTISGLQASLEKDVPTLERIQERLINTLAQFLLHHKPLTERPSLGESIHLHPVGHAFGFPHLAGERYRVAMRMGGARVGKEIGHRLLEAGVNPDETVERIVNLLEYCNVGTVTAEETIRIEDNAESSYTKIFKTRSKEPACFFTTGFLNGLFSVAKGQHAREIRCIAAGDPYCEWEIT